jgi:pyrroline-5-carboxylate reductase
MAATVGIIGAGHLIRHMMPAMAKGPERFVVSQRGRDTSAALAARFGCTIEADNQAIVDASDIVVLAVRPYDTLALAQGLRFRQEQAVVSLAAGVSHADLAPLVAPASLDVAMPVVAAEFAESPTLLYPGEPRIRALIERCGPAIVLDSEAQFTPGAVHACVYGWIVRLIGEMEAWSLDHGLSPETSRLLSAQMVRAAATVARERKDTPMADLVGELATPRSFTGAGIRRLDGHQVFAHWRKAMDHILDRLKAGSAE